MRSLVVAFFVAISSAAEAQSAAPLRVVGTSALTARELAYAGAVPATHELTLNLYAFRDTPWESFQVIQAVRDATPLFAQCGIRLAGAELRLLDGGDPQLRDLSTPMSRQLVRRLQPEKPAVFFVHDTRNRPEFDGEAFGRGNTKTRPELAGTVWLTVKTRDLRIALAHELAHVLMDSAEHSYQPGNLMREDTAPENSALLPAQCERMRLNGTANSWLTPVTP